MLRACTIIAHNSKKKREESNTTVLMAILHPSLFLLILFFHRSVLSTAPSAFVQRIFNIYTRRHISSSANSGHTDARGNTLRPIIESYAIAVYTTNVHLSDTSPFRNSVRKALGKLFLRSRRSPYPDKVFEILVLPE